MLKINLLCVYVLLALTFPVLAAKTKKDEALPLRKGKKGKAEPPPATKKAPSPIDRANAKITNLHPKAQIKMNAALKDMDKAGVCPTITSAYRSRAQQHDMYRCARRHQCRVQRGVYGANKPGTSLHEAGLAVDLANVARGKKRSRRLTHDGRKIVKVMQKHGFKWRYGLKDPAHFELDPRTAGYKSEKAAIAAAAQRDARQRLAVKRAVQAQSKPKSRRRNA
ncbi:MAG TPA: M15 family metallopeptidase [Blastocatellia bacterium]|nr:M15 family metallopeptidase [Blastocatellia bacterium]